MKSTIAIGFTIINYFCFGQLDSASIVGEYYDTTCFHHCSYLYLEIKEDGDFVFRGSNDYRKWKRKGTWTCDDEMLTLCYRKRKGANATVIYAIIENELWTIDEKTGKPWEYNSLVKAAD